MGFGAEGEAPNEVIGLFDENLASVDYHAFDRGLEDHLTREGVEGHLVAGRPLVEEVGGDGGGGGFVVHDVDFVVERDDAVEVATQ